MKTYYIAQGNCSVLCGDLKGKEIQKREGIYVELIYCAVQQKHTQHCKLILLQLKNKLKRNSIDPK